MLPDRYDENKKIPAAPSPMTCLGRLYTGHAGTGSVNTGNRESTRPAKYTDPTPAALLRPAAVSRRHPPRCSRQAYPLGNIRDSFGVLEVARRPGSGSSRRRRFCEDPGKARSWAAESGPDRILDATRGKRYMPQQHEVTRVSRFFRQIVGKIVVKTPNALTSLRHSLKFQPGQIEFSVANCRDV